MEDFRWQDPPPAELPQPRRPEEQVPRSNSRWKLVESSFETFTWQHVKGAHAASSYDRDQRLAYVSTPAKYEAFVRRDFGMKKADATYYTAKDEKMVLLSLRRPRR